ncbi:MAG: o-succinylbenzoate synthase, partial [Prochlorothrix sp.]
MDVTFQFRHYSRVFRHALFTPLGVWSSRLGMVVRLQQGDRVAYGDITPIPWFAGESFDEVFQFCGRWQRQLTHGVTAEAIAAIPASLPATQFGLGWAWEQLQRLEQAEQARQARQESERESPGDRESGLAPNTVRDPGIETGAVTRTSAGTSAGASASTVPKTTHTRPPGINPAQFWPDQTQLDREPALPQAALLPQGQGALAAWEELWTQGYRTFKLKVGDRSLDQDLALIQTLCGALPGEARLRLDANGKLEEAEARQLLEQCDRWDSIEFVEQPIAARLYADISLGPLEPEVAAAIDNYTPWPLLQRLAQDYRTPIAVDEAVTTVEQVRLAYDQGWRGVFVLKPSLAGSPQAVRDLFALPALDLVFSSAFESALGRQAVLALAAELATQNPGHQRAA